MSFDPLVYSRLRDVNERVTELESRVGGPEIFGAYWDRQSSPTLVRTHSAKGLTAAIGLNGNQADNDFDSVPIFGEMGVVQDDLGNSFVRIPRFYIRKQKGADFRTWEVSKSPLPGFYLPKCFWDFRKNRELPWVGVGAHLAGLNNGKLTSRPGTHPRVHETINAFRSYATANNGSVPKYQQLDVHTYDVIQTLLLIEFGTLDLQSIAPGFSNGAYSSSHTITSAAANTNNVIVSDATATNFVTGQSVSIGASHDSDEVSGQHTPRVITAITDNSNGTHTITIDGDPVTVQVGNVIASRAYRTGWSAAIAASSGSIDDGSDKRPFSYRGIESPYGELHQCMDGVNTTSYQAWVADDPEGYASDKFAAPYEQLGYVNRNTNGYIRERGHDAAHPHAEFAVSTSGGSGTYYADHYYRGSDARVALVGGSLNNGSNDGPFMVAFDAPSSFVNARAGARLIAKAL